MSNISVGLQLSMSETHANNLSEKSDLDFIRGSSFSFLSTHRDVCSNLLLLSLSSELLPFFDYSLEIKKVSVDLRLFKSFQNF